jgi:uncharacterized protein (TIGR02246 family)
VVQRQVEAYNAGDLDTFCALYTDDVVIVDDDGRPFVRGKAALRDRYGAIFAERHTAEILARHVASSWVIDHEVVQSGDRRLEAVVAYRVNGTLIDRVHLLRS